MSNIYSKDTIARNVIIPFVQGGISNLSSGTKSITFPVAFKTVPAVVCNWSAPQGATTSAAICCFNVSVISNTSFTVYGTYTSVNSGSNSNVTTMGNDAFTWVAIAQ